MKKTLFMSERYIFSAIFCGFVCLLSVVAFPSFASASSNLSISPASGTYVIGSVIPVSVNINTNGNSINAAEAYLTFDQSKFQVTSLDTTSSIFSAWPKLEFSNTNGTIHFAGGLPSPGFNGALGSILKVNLKATGLGIGNVSFNSGSTSSPSILLNDGLGTEDFGNSSGATYTIIPAPLSVSCSGSPSSVMVNNSVSFKASASGESGTYTYSWTGDCSGNSSTCSNSFSTTGTKTATVTATSNGKSLSASCSVGVGLPGPVVSCTSPDYVEVGQPITFNASVIGGDGTYAYSWSNACTGNSSTCSNSLNTPGIKKATVTATSDGKTSSANCLFYAGNLCPVNSNPQTMQSSGAPVAQTANDNYTPSLCPEYLTSYIKLGDQNDSDQVKKLQTFLNTYEGTDLIVDGVYKTADVNAVKDFQLKYKTTILDFWNSTQPSGYVYVSTLKAINRVYCENTKGMTCPYFSAPTNAKNSSSASEVLKIRKFLVDTQDENISTTSTTFNTELTDAIKRFQAKYPQKVLTPWNISAPTGLWYQSTRRYADELLGCYYPVKLDNGVVVQ